VLPKQFAHVRFSSSLAVASSRADRKRHLEVFESSDRSNSIRDDSVCRFFKKLRSNDSRP